jgi:hypothetical protein
MQRSFASTPMMTLSLLLLLEAGGSWQTASTQGGSVMSKEGAAVSPAGAGRWEQAFSADGGKTWETNWIMQFTRDGGQ